MKKHLILSCLLIIGIQLVYAQQGWVYVAVDSTTPITTKLLSTPVWTANKIASDQEGVFFAGGFRNSSGKYYVGYWNRVTSIWYDDGKLNANGDVITIGMFENSVDNNIFVAGNFTNGEGLHSVAEKTVGIWKDLGASNYADPDAQIAELTKGGFKLYASGRFKRSLPNNREHYYRIAVRDNSSWSDIGDTMINKLIHQHLGDSYNWNETTTKIKAGPSEELYVAVSAFDLNIGSNNLNKICVFKYSGKTWSLYGKPFTDYSTLYSGYGSVHAMAVGPNITDGLTHVAGSFKNAQGEYYIAKLSSSNWSEFGEMNDLPIGTKFHPNGIVRGLASDGLSVYAAGEFTGKDGDAIVVKFDIGLEAGYVLGNESLNAKIITDITWGGQYVDDIFVSSLFPYSENNNINETYYLAHFSPVNCSSVVLKTSTNNYSFGDPVTFTTYSYNVGSNPRYAWKKNGTIIPNQYKSSYTDASLQNNDKITCTVMGNSDCSTAPVSDSVIVSFKSLPVNISTFDVNREANKVVCKWTTLSELNTSRFLIERSSDGRKFDIIGQLQASNNSTAVKNYIYNDYNFKEAKSNNAFYRLTTVDKDDKIQISKIERVSIQSKNSFQVSPNPSRGQISIFGHNLKFISIINLLGKEILKKQFYGNQISLDLSKIPKGMYFIKATNTNGIIETQSFLLE